MFFIFMVFMGLKDIPVRDYRVTPTQALVALPYDPARLAPWAPDYTSRRVTFATEGVPAPAASDYSTRGNVQLAENAEPSLDALERENADLRKRIDDLERMMKGVVSQPPVPAPQPEQVITNGMKSVPGWLVEMYPWNKKGVLAPDPVQTLLTESCPFNGNFGRRSESQMAIYRFMGVFRAKSQGRYVFAVDTTCAFGHSCNLIFSVDGSPIIDFHGRTDYKRLQNGVPLAPGDHTLELKLWLKSNQFLKYNPGEMVQWHPLVKTEVDLNARDYAADELFAVVPESTKLPVQGCVR